MNVRNLVLAALLLGATSCSMVVPNILQMLSIDNIPKEVRQTIVTFHTIDTTNVRSRLVSNVNVDGRQLAISKPILSNRDIVYAEPFECSKGKYGLQFELTGKGLRQWQQASVSYRGTRGVMAIGGHFKCFILFSNDHRGPRFQVAAHLSKKEAEKISEDIIRNYEVIKENP